jgi:hypothetical protein
MGFPGCNSISQVELNDVLACGLWWSSKDSDGFFGDLAFIGIGQKRKFDP